MDVVGSPIRDESAFPLAIGNEISTSRMSASFHKCYPPMRVYTYFNSKYLAGQTVICLFLKQIKLLQDCQSAGR